MSKYLGDREQRIVYKLPVLHEIFATLKFREIGEAIFRETLIAQFCGNFKS